MNNHREEVIATFMRLIGDVNAAVKLRSLAINQASGHFESWQIIELPKWASDITPKGYNGLLAPIWSNEKTVKWEQYDWWRAAHFMINNEWERSYEKQKGPIHSYSY